MRPRWRRSRPVRHVVTRTLARSFARVAARKSSFRRLRLRQQNSQGLPGRWCNERRYQARYLQRVELRRGFSSLDVLPGVCRRPLQSRRSADRGGSAPSKRSACLPVPPRPANTVRWLWVRFLSRRSRSAYADDSALRACLPTGGPGVYVSAVKSNYRPFRRKSEPEPASALVSDVVGKLGGSWRGKEQRVFLIYADVGGDFLRKHTRPDSLRNGTLFIRVSSSAIAHHLTLLRGEILQRLGALLPPGTVTDIRTRVGPLA